MTAIETAGVACLVGGTAMLGRRNVDLGEFVFVGLTCGGILLGARAYELTDV